VTALHGTVRSYKIIYADSLSFFSDISFVGNEKKKRKIQVCSWYNILET